LVSRYVGKFGKFLKSCNQIPGHAVEFVNIGIFESVLVLGAADAIIDGEILHRLHVKLDSFNLRQLRSKPFDDATGGNAALFKRLQVDLDATAVKRSVRAVGSNE